MRDWNVSFYLNILSILITLQQVKLCQVWSVYHGIQLRYHGSNRRGSANTEIFCCGPCWANFRRDSQPVILLRKKKQLFRSTRPTHSHDQRWSLFSHMSSVLTIVCASVRLSVPTFQNIAKQNKLEVKIIIAAGVTVGLAEGITDDNYLVSHIILFYFFQVKVGLVQHLLELPRVKVLMVISRTAPWTVIRYPHPFWIRLVQFLRQYPRQHCLQRPLRQFSENLLRKCQLLPLEGRKGKRKFYNFV